MKAKPVRVIDGEYTLCEPHEATHLIFKFPGPIRTRVLPVMIGGTRKGTQNWTWNGDVDKPTIKPSVLTTGGGNGEGGKQTCHSFVNDGKVQFLSDCSHELAGQTVDLLDVL